MSDNAEPSKEQIDAAIRARILKDRRGTMISDGVKWCPGCGSRSVTNGHNTCPDCDSSIPMTSAEFRELDKKNRAFAAAHAAKEAEEGEGGDDEDWEDDEDEDEDWEDDDEDEGEDENGGEKK